MSDALFAFFDIGLVFALALGLAVWQLAVLKRGIRKDRDEAAQRAADDSVSLSAKTWLR